MADHSGGPRSNISAFNRTRGIFEHHKSSKFILLDVRNVICVKGNMVNYENRNCGKYKGPTIMWQMLSWNNNHLPSLWISDKLVRWGDGACQGRRISWRQRLMKGRGTQSCTTTEGQEMVGFTIFVVDGPFALPFWQLCGHSRFNPQEKHHSHNNLTPVRGTWTSLNSCQDA